METLTFKLQEDNFEGPLDLLLYLVGKNKMNLYDINIMELIEQYTAAIQTMQADKLEVSSEFIDMAAHLVQMKSALLLPRSPEAERMKAELTGRLIEYSTCKQVAAELGSRARDLYTAVRQPQKPEGPAEYSRKQDPDRLVQAWFSLMGRSQRRKKPTQERFEPLVTAPFVSVASRVAHMLRGMLKGTLCRMGQLFSPQESRSTNVATFLALLELIRAGRVRLDETGTLTTPELLLPYGTYEVREVKPPEGYLSEGVLSRMFEIREHGKTVALNTAETAIRNVPIRGDLEGVKIADGTAARLAGVPFKITSKTTGESHVVVTDANGQFSTASEWAPHSQNTNAGETHMDGVWFGEIEALNDVAGALPYDTYVLEEQPCAANENMELLTFEVSVYRNGYTIHLGTLTDDYIPQPEIFTTALEKESMTQEAYAAESVTTLDTVYYSGLKSGTEYVLKGILMDKATGEPLMIGEKQVTAEKTFRATAESGSVTMEFTFDASSLKGKTVVVFETLYLADTEIASHADIEDVEQSITFQNPQIGTSAAGRNGEKALDITAEAEIVDTVRYSGLIPGREYTLHGSLMDKATGEAVRENGVPISAETVFTAEAESGTVQVTFTVDAAALKGKTVVVFEHLLYRGREIAAHADIEDENQTVSFVEPKIGTSAADEKGKKVLLASSDAKIIDTVTYENLTVGKEYTLKGVLMDKSTGIPLLVGGKEITAEVKFKPDKAFGKVEVPFALDASTLAGAEVVVFETLYLDGREIAAHKDIEDEGQTVSFAELVLKLAKINSATKENLDGAEFTLYDAAGKEIKLSKDKDGVYYPDEKGSAVITTEKGVAIISGLSGGELTLKEIKAPDGFVGYTEPIKFTMTLRDASMDDPFPVTVYNAPEGSKTGSGAKTGRDGLPTWALTAGICALAAAGAVGFVWLKKKHMQ